MAGEDDTEPTAAADAGGKKDSTTARVVAVLDALARAEEGGVGVRQLATVLGVSRSAVHRVLQNLADLRVANALPSGNYEPGEVLAAWATFLGYRQNVLELSKGLLDRLVERAEETAYLTTFAGGRLTTVAAAECDRPVRYVLPIGGRLPLERGAAGKAVLAHLGEEVLTELALPETEATRLRADLAETRERGYAVSIGENIPDACGFAAAYFTNGRPAGSITVTVPRYRAADDAADRFGPLVKDTARALTNLLTARPDD
ncbi:transcriptional regulator [Pseudonocardia sulfidoxydans NBRC 16205]|uniref:Transcriptional regulator n=2 Tax=Pseudonocardia sulfidoxydans TaxID=54011 RepID=A0A511DRB3_9PSEU|nr:IclR family transcriptional regulator [Pseudonocardia sulfidoxydans]GEL26773.1 transcriptional regulator [Pseudonocardia sulfidoxydans NBRC 16205]